MAKNSSTEFPSRITAKKSCPPRRYTPKIVFTIFQLVSISIIRPNKMSTEEDELKLELTTQVLRKTYQYTYASTDSSEMRCTCRVSSTSPIHTSGSLKTTRTIMSNHEQNYVLQCPLCSYSDDSKEEELNLHLTNPHSKITFVSDNEVTTVLF